MPARVIAARPSAARCSDVTWTAPTAFVWDGLGSTFKTCCEFNVLSPSQATLLIATNTPAAGGTTLYSGAVDATGHASFAGISVTAGTTYFIGYGNLTGSGMLVAGLAVLVLLQSRRRRS